MRALLACLLLGSISCVPMKRQTSSDGDSGPAWQQWYQNPGSGQLGQGSTQGGASVYGYGSSADYGSDGGQVPQISSSQQGTGQQDVLIAHPEEEFWTDTSDLEPVHAFNSRSRYQRGRVVYAQTRYTPTEYYYIDQDQDDDVKGGAKY